MNTIAIILALPWAVSLIVFLLLLRFDCGAYEPAWDDFDAYRDATRAWGESQ